MLLRGCTGSCAVCGKSLLTIRWVQLQLVCDRCQFPVERTEGHFVGGVGINTIVTFGVVLIGLLLAIGLSAPDPISSGPVAVVLGSVAVTTSVVFYPVSRTLWSALDLLLTPLKPGEVDPRYDPHVVIEDRS